MVDNRESGRSFLETLITLLIVVSVVPKIISTVLFVLASVLALAIPWIGLILLVAVAGGCLAAVLASRPSTHVVDGRGVVPPAIAPTPRPSEISYRRHDE